MDVANIEKKIDRTIAAPMPLAEDQAPGLHPKNLGEAMELAKLMAISGPAVPKYLRGNPGHCLAIVLVATRWQMDAFAVASKSYVVINRGEDRIAYEAQLVHAVINTRAPLQGRLRHEITGEDDERRCKVWGTFKGEHKPHVYESETLKKLRDARGRNEQGAVKGSPLWEQQPEVQLAYSAYRQWARTFTPETLLGVYVPDEFENGEPNPEPLVALGDRLRAAKQEAARGFDASHVNREAGQVIEGEANKEEQDVFNEAAEQHHDEPDSAGGQGGDQDRRDGAHDEARRDSGGGMADEAGGKPAEPQAAGPSPAPDHKERPGRKGKKQ